MRPLLRRALCVALAVISAVALCALPRPVAAQTATPAAPLEINLGNFVLLGDSTHEAELNGLAQRNGPALDQAYAQLSRLYGTSLALPINIRVYSDWVQFIGLNNALAAPIASPYHTHVGTREIALIGPLPAGLLGSPDGLNMVRHELSGLFLDTLTENNMPPGLGLGINQYMQAPGEQTEVAAARLRAAMPSGRAALLPWPDLFDGSSVHLNRELATAQALSIVAFLVDRYGFEALLDVINGLGDGHSYRSAMSGIYGQPLEQLEADWWAYLPGFADGGWQHNALYNYNLAPYEAALDAGAYAQVLSALDRVIPFLELTDQSSAFARAQTLREEARQGLAARELTARLGEALQAGEYETALDLALQAQTAYAAIGDAANASIASAHADYIRQILALRDELAEAQARALANPGPAVEADLKALVPRFQALGDADGERQAIDTLNSLYALQAEEVEQRRELSRQIITIASAVAVALLALEAVRALAQRRRRVPRIL